MLRLIGLQHQHTLSTTCQLRSREAVFGGRVFFVPFRGAQTPQDLAEMERVASNDFQHLKLPKQRQQYLDMISMK